MELQCVKPLDAWKDGSTVKLGKNALAVVQLKLPCGQCIACRLERSRQWAVRIMHEAQLHESNWFVTLTYNDETCPVSLDYRDFRLFMKTLRKHQKVRFYMCGEYGDQTNRPHFHAILFGLTLTDLKPWRKNKYGQQIFRSAFLEKIWTKGNSEIGRVEFTSAAYVSRYVTKKMNGEKAKEHYTRLDPSTGELIEIEPEFANMSRRPGIGYDWFKKFHSDVFPHDRVISNGHPAKPPRYYDKLLERQDKEASVALKAARQEKRSTRNKDDETPERLRDKEVVLIAATSLKKRNN